MNNRLQFFITCQMASAVHSAPLNTTYEVNAEAGAKAFSRNLLPSKWQHSIQLHRELCDDMSTDVMHITWWN